ncbi:MAG: helix-hairpin-helix domain-containing protein, partial [Chloroflexi bacterium]|nr:helix-hairpin-helix domain-containing protein [Chloroflexota bacterium]
DEAHRFAITYHRNVRGKASIKSALDDVPGIGPAKKKALLRKFGSVAGIKKATMDEIIEVQGVTMKLAVRLKELL